MPIVAFLAVAEGAQRGHIVTRRISEQNAIRCPGLTHAPQKQEEEKRAIMVCSLLITFLV